MSNVPQYLINISNLPPAGEAIVLSADEKILDTVSQECGVTHVSHLNTKFRVKRWRKHGVTIYGDFDIKLEQECVASLGPVFSNLKNTFERRFLPQRDSDYKMPEVIDGEMILDPEADDIPDIIEGDAIDLWEVLIEELILVIDPFPRLENYQSEMLNEEVEPIEETKEPTHKPFSNLKALITEKKTKK